MIHEVRLPRENRIYLRQITHMQMGVLASAVTLQPGFSQQNLQGALVNQMGGARAGRVAGWVWNHKDTREGLQAFVTGASGERQTLVEAMWQDVLRLACAQRGETLECCFAGNLKNYQQGAKQFLLAFYDQLGDGISAEIFAHNPCDYRKYGREQFFQAYESANPNQLMCAICDEHRPISVVRGSYMSDIEHYFPKSIYPHLACHPYNLIPICSACNSAHLNRDPLTPRNGGKRRTLGEVFLPYRRDSVRLQGAIKLDWAQFSMDVFQSRRPSILNLTFDELQLNTTQAFAAKIQAFSEIYDIPRRWQERIHSIGEQLWRQMSAFVRTGIDNVEPLDPPKIKTVLERLLHYLLQDLGVSPWDFVLVWYLSHLLVAELEAAVQAQKPIEEIPVARTLEDIIRQPVDTPSPVLSAETVLETSRKMYANTPNPFVR